MDATNDGLANTGALRTDGALGRLASRVARGALAIDAHAHVGTWSRPPWAGVAGDWPTSVRTWKDAGVHAAVVFPTGPHGNEELLTQIQAGPAFPVWLFPWVAPEVPETLAWVRAHADVTAGLKVHPSFDGCRFDQPAMEPIFDLAREHDFIVQVHCGRWQEMAGYEIALSVADKHPDIRFILAHMGGDAPELKLGVVEGLHARKLDNVWIELSCTREFWAIERQIGVYGSDRLCYGSDWSMHHPLAVMVSMLGANLDDATLDAVFATHALACLEQRPMLHAEAMSDALREARAAAKACALVTAPGWPTTSGSPPPDGGLR